MLLAQHGEWQIRVDDPAHRVKLTQIMRSAFNTPLADAIAAASSVPGAVYSGTLGEVLLLAERLTADAIPSTLVGPTFIA
jgi:hypothetical protein